MATFLTNKSNVALMENEIADVQSSIRFTVFNVLKAFINESIIASEADLGYLELLSMEESGGIAASIDNVFLYKFKVHTSSNEYIIEATHDYCGDILDIHEIYDADRRPISISIEWICEIIGTEKKSCYDLLTINSEMALKMFNKLADYRNENKEMDLKWDRKSMFILLEQKFNVDRPKINPISHAFMGNVEHHPYLMDKTWIEVPIYRSKSSNIEYSTVGPLKDDPSYLSYMKLFGDKEYIPLHPYSVDYFNENHPEIMDDLVLVDKLKCAPTTSVRTLLYLNDDSDASDFQLKCSYTAQITSHSRVLNKEEALNGIRTSDVFMKLIEKGLWPKNVYFIPEICMMNHRENSILSCLLRGGLNSVYPKLKDSEILIPSFSLCSPSPINDRTLYEQLQSFSGLTSYEFFKSIAEALIHGYLGLVKYGLGHESHAQNTLIVWDYEQNKISGVCFRDIESTKITKKILAQYNIVPTHENSSNARETRSMAVLEDDNDEIRKYFLTSMYTHGIIDSQLSYIVKLLTDTKQHDSTKLIQLCKTIYLEWWNQNGFSYTEYCDVMSNYSTRKNLLSKGLELNTTPVPYRSISHNPFFPNYTEVKDRLR